MKHDEILQKAEYFQKAAQSSQMAKPNTVPGNIQDMLNQALQESLAQYNLVKKFQERLNAALQMTDVRQKSKELQELNIQSHFLPDKFASAVSALLSNLMQQFRY